MKSGVGSENTSNKKEHLKYERRNIVSASVQVPAEKWEGKMGRYTGKIAYMPPYRQ